MNKATIIEAQNSNTEYESGKTKGILGTLKGIFADYKNGTRNGGRLYSEELWDNRVFGSEDVMEALNTKTLFGELDHPDGDRCETLAQNAAITITKLEKRPDEGVIYGEAEILDTPTGRIVKALADSGAQLGISSRGMGEEIFDGVQNIIDPETYDFITFDVVVTPANTKARVSLAESKHIDKLTESIKREIKESKTENQLSQIKTVLENVSLSNKEEINNLVEDKLNTIKEMPKENLKITEANKRLVFNMLNKTIESKIVENEELQKTNEDLKKQLEENKVDNTLEHKLQESREEIKKLKAIVIKTKADADDLVTGMRQVTTKKLENKELEYKENITKLEEQLNKVQNENIKLLENESELNKILTNNKELEEVNIKLITENKELKAQLQIQNKKLTESKTVQEDKIKQLTEQVQKLQEINERLSKVSFNPIGQVESLQKPKINENWTDEDEALFKIMINK